VLQAARFYARHNPHGTRKLRVPKVVKEMLEVKEADRMSDVYVKDLRGRPGRFQERFKGPIALMTSAEIEDFLRALRGRKGKRALSGKSRNSYGRAIATLFYFTESRGYLPKGFVQVDSVALAKEENGEIEIFRPDELTRLLAQAEPELIPFLMIGAFAGLWYAEIQRLDWAEVRLEDGFIEVKAGKA